MITSSIFRAKSPRVAMTARSSPRGRSVIPRSDRRRKKKDKRQRERDDPTRANPRARRTVLVERIDKTGAAKGNTLYMPTTFPKCSVQFFAATSAAGSLWRASEWLRSFEVDARAKQTRTCSLAYASLRASAYTCIHARAPLVRACVRCVRAPVAGEERKKGEGKREIYLPEFRWPPLRCGRAASEECISHSGSFAEYVLRRILPKGFPSSSIVAFPPPSLLSSHRESLMFALFKGRGQRHD